MNNIVYWIWLSEALGQGEKTLELVSFYNWNAEEIYKASVRDIFALGIYTLGKVKKFKAYPLEKAENSYNDAVTAGMKIVTPQSELFPEPLKRIDNCPLVLYVYGDETVLKNELSISVVGAREASDYGCAVAKALSSALASKGFIIVSGGARGIDSEAHFGAMEEGGKTVCVLGCGLNTNYLAELKPMRDKIALNGAVISEYPPKTPASRTTFPIRNRIISALTLGTIVVEAGERSGSLITARLALEQGKDVFAVPGDLVHSSFLGTNKLIRDGAIAVFSPNDILEEYYSEYYDKIVDKTRFPDDEIIKRAQSYLSKSKTAVAEKAKEHKSKEKHKKEKKAVPDYLTEAAKKIYAVLNEEPKHVDLLSEESGLTTAQTLSALTELEVYSLAVSLSGRRYIIKD
ncbi:MAG: DNA-processing protein DprA [Oscillospiraceae bacterium]|nr:DNA-processing protein DprA [Oscillospiraceae bacterium]